MQPSLVLFFEAALAKDVFLTAVTTQTPVVVANTALNEKLLSFLSSSNKRQIQIFSDFPKKYFYCLKLIWNSSELFCRISKWWAWYRGNKIVTHPLFHLFLFFHFFLFCFNLPAPFMINRNRLRILLQGGKTLLDLKIEIKARPISSNLAKGGEFEKYFLGALSEKCFSIKRHGRRPDHFASRLFGEKKL